MPTLDLELLRTLAAVVTHRSFAAAAVHLDRTQSAVTQQMQRLEEQIGHPLFAKQGRQKRLTEHGQRLLNYAHHLLALNDEALRSLREQGEELHKAGNHAESVEVLDRALQLLER